MGRRSTIGRRAALMACCCCPAAPPVAKLIQDNRKQGGFYGGVTGGRTQLAPRSTERVAGSSSATAMRILLGHATRSPTLGYSQGRSRAGRELRRRRRPRIAGGDRTEVAVNRADAAGGPRLSARQGFGVVCLDAAGSARSEEPRLRLAFTCCRTGPCCQNSTASALFSWDEALGRVGKSMARVLDRDRPEQLLRRFEMTRRSC